MPPKYKGILARPMRIGEGLDAYWKRFVALAKHYDINLLEKGSSTSLALRLAIDYMPGFRFAQGDLPPRKGSAARDAALVVRMGRRIEEGHSVKRAAVLVARAYPDLGFKSAEALRVRYVQLVDPKNKRLAKQRELMVGVLYRALMRNEAK